MGLAIVMQEKQQILTVLCYHKLSITDYWKDSALRGKDYNSDFLSKRKEKKLETLIKYPEYIETFAILGKHEVLEDKILKVLENFL